MKTQPLPPVVLLIITFNRYQIVKKTVEALLDNLVYPDLRIIISDDHTGGNYVRNLSRIKRWKEAGIEVIETPERMGWGDHVNWAMTQCREKHPDAKYIFQIEDDYVLSRRLRLDVGVALLERKKHIGMLRYRGTAGSHMVYHQMRTANIGSLVQGYVEGFGKPNELTYLLIDGGSPDLWVYSNGPHLKSMGFHAHYGAYPTKKSLGSTEEGYAHQVKDRMRIPDAPAIAILPDWIHMHFDHLGETWQRTKDDIHHKG